MISHVDRRGLTRREVLATGLGATGLAATGMLVTGRPAVARPTGATGAAEGDRGGVAPQTAPSRKSTHGWNVIIQFDRAISSAMVLTSTGLVTW